MNHRSQFIASEAQKQAEMVKARTEQELASRAQELQHAAIQQATILKDKEQQLLQQQVQFSTPFADNYRKCFTGSWAKSRLTKIRNMN